MCVRDYARARACVCVCVCVCVCCLATGDGVLKLNQLFIKCYLQNMFNVKFEESGNANNAASRAMYLLTQACHGIC